jgi:hypothetical protein
VIYLRVNPRAKFGYRIMLAGADPAGQSWVAEGKFVDKHGVHRGVYHWHWTTRAKATIYPNAQAALAMAERAERDVIVHGFGPIRLQVRPVRGGGPISRRNPGDEGLRRAWRGEDPVRRILEAHRRGELEFMEISWAAWFGSAAARKALGELGHDYTEDDPIGLYHRNLPRSEGPFELGWQVAYWGDSYPVIWPNVGYGWGAAEEVEAKAHVTASALHTLRSYDDVALTQPLDPGPGWGEHYIAALALNRTNVGDYRRTARAWRDGTLGDDPSDPFGAAKELDSDAVEAALGFRDPHIVHDWLPGKPGEGFTWWGTNPGRHVSYPRRPW